MVYVRVLGVGVVLGVVVSLRGIFSFWPILRVLVERLFRDLILFTVVLYFLAILYMVSPFFTV